MKDNTHSGSLLLNLPDTAWQRLIEFLVHEDSSVVLELMRCSKSTRLLVRQHAPAVTYTPRAEQNQQDIHSLASRKSDLFLTLDCSEVPSASGVGDLLHQAAFLKTSLGPGWFAVTKLRLSGFQTLLDYDRWHHLVGIACPRMHTLELENITVGIPLISSLMAASHLRHLSLGNGCSVQPDLALSSGLLPRWLPSLSQLSLRGAFAPCTLLPGVASQLTELTIRQQSVLPRSHDGHLDTISKALPLCTNLTSVYLPPECLTNEVMEVLLGMEHLRHVAVRCTHRVTRSFAHRPCKWQSLTFGGVNAVACIPLLPLRDVKMVEVQSLQVPVTADAAAVRSQVQAAAETLAGLAREGRFQWWGNDSVYLVLGYEAHLMTGIQGTANAADTLAPELLPEASVHAALSSWAPLQPFTKVINLAWFVSHGHDIRPSKRRLTGADLKALAVSFGPSLKQLVLECMLLAPDVWHVLQSSVLPQLTKVELGNFSNMSAADLAVFCATATRPMTLRIFNPMYHTAYAIVQARAALEAMGVQSPVQLEVDDAGDVMEVIAAEGDEDDEDEGEQEGEQEQEQ